MASRWDEFDAVYVNGNVPLAHRAASRRPTLLMLPGPVSDDETHLLPAIQAVCSHDDGLTAIRAVLGDEAAELPLGLDGDVFRPAPDSVRAQLGWSERELVIGFVGRLDLIKGVDLLASAFASLARAVPEARLLMVGSGEEEARIRSVLAKEVANGGVHLQPRMSQEDLPRWYRAMDVLVMPSRYETMSNAVLEAMACGVPFVASAVGGSRELVKTKAGWLFTPESASSLAQVLQAVAASRGELSGRGLRATRHVHETLQLGVQCTTVRGDHSNSTWGDCVTYRSPAAAVAAIGTVRSGVSSAILARVPVLCPGVLLDHGSDRRVFHQHVGHRHVDDGGRRLRAADGQVLASHAHPDRPAARLRCVVHRYPDAVSRQRRRRRIRARVRPLDGRTRSSSSA